jgi:hypothetical protein
MRYLDEMMSGIKTIKFNSMESYFDKRVILNINFNLFIQLI